MPKNFKDEFPFHWSIWNNDVTDLQQLLNLASKLPDEHKKAKLEQLDTRGRTPLILAVVLKRIECVELLLKHGADATAVTKEFWSVVDEAVCSGDKNLIKLCVKYRDYQRNRHRCHVANEVIEKLSRTTDFYVEMKWEFNSWIPFVSKMCPSDTYTVYKRGRNVRVDTTLQGFDEGEWKRGRQTFIFKASTGNQGAEFFIIDHELKTIFSEKIQKSDSYLFANNGNNAAGNNENLEPDEEDINYYGPSDHSVDSMVKSPITTLYVDLDKVSFERKQTGIFGMKSDKNEEINGYQCKVYSTSNVELITKVRMEHLSEKDKQEYQNKRSTNSTMLDSLLTWLQGSETKSSGTMGGGDLTPETYFNPLSPQDFKRDVGLPKELSVRRRSFNANLSLCDDYPLSLIEQVSPIVDIMASTNAHFSRLKDFLTLQLPSGFPVKIEIPIFHVINAVVTFDNVHGENRPVSGVTFLSDAQYKCCAIDDDLFDVPSNYSSREMTSDQFNWAENEEMALLQYAIRESMYGSEGNLPARLPYASLNFSEEELALQRAIDASLHPQENQSEINANNFEFDRPPSPLDRQEQSNFTNSPPQMIADESRGPTMGSAAAASSVNPSSQSRHVTQDDLELVLALSLQEEEERKKRIEEEERDLERILAQSLKEQ